MSEEHREQGPEDDVQQHAESKSEEERELEQEWSQGGQDVEEEQHDEPFAPSKGDG